MQGKRKLCECHTRFFFLFLEGYRYYMNRFSPNSLSEVPIIQCFAYLTAKNDSFLATYINILVNVEEISMVGTTS